MAFKIGEAYVEVTAKVNKDGIRRDIESALGDAEKSASSSGERIGKAITESIKGSLGSIKQTVDVKLRETVDSASSHGSQIGTKMMGAVADSIISAGGQAQDAMAKTMTGAVSGSLSTPILGPIIIAALAAAAAVAAPVIGALVAGAMVLGIGAGIVGIGVMLLAENEKVKAAYTKSWGEIKTVMTDAAKPLIPVMTTVLDVMKKVTQAFAPVIEQSLKLAQGPLQSFVKNLGDAFIRLTPAIQPMMKAFTDILNTIGPALPSLFGQISDALSSLATTVSENKTLISTLFVAMLQAIPLVISGISTLTGVFGTMMSVFNNVMSAGVSAFAAMSEGALTFVQNILGALRNVAVAIGNFPGMEELSKKMVQGIDTAIQKVGEWKTASQVFAKEVQLKANIVDLTQKIDKAKAQLNDPNLIDKKRIAKLEADITDLMKKKGDAVVALGDPKLIKDYKSQITTDIGQLQSRLKTAKSELQNPELTKTRKSELRAEIAQLQAQVRAAKQALDSVQSKSVSITVNTIYNGSPSAAAAIANKVREKGAIDRYASGAVRRATPPQIATRPTILFGEGRDDEAFIPYDRAMRGRATKLLGEVAGDFGYQLAPAGAKAASGGNTTNYFNVTIPARDIAEMKTATDFFNKAQSLARSGAR